ncbi:hypothetical protein [Paraflavitalea speifideaquila]|uniref:hypothetical protein n=1 Tax=Paraflavitalea speifideaquila TaxID=3076558 RepID=UPI0028E1D1DA|nr:hypothetical protein [Paraflavitalea speifideiaquila]
MLPLKWKIFRVFSYLHMTCTVLIAVLALAIILDTGLRFQTKDDILALLTLLFVPTILLGNSSVNLFLLEKFYPDRLPGKKLRVFSVVLFILCLLVTILALALAAIAFYEISSRKTIRCNRI